MKLLLDENLSRRLVPLLEDVFPESSQVTLLGLERATDKQIWDYAKTRNFVIVTRDADFAEMSLLLGAPPGIVWLRGDNLSNTEILHVLKEHEEFIRERLAAGTACVEIIKRGV